MAQALIVDFESDFDPTLPVDLHPLGVGGYVNRYVADTLGEAAAAPLGTWKDRQGTLDLKAPSDAKRPVVGVENGFKYVSFDGISQGLKAAYTAGTIKTIVMVARPRSAAGSSTNLLFAGGANLVQSSTKAAGILVSGGAAAVYAAANTLPSDKWAIVIGVVDGNSSLVRSNGSASPSPTGTATGLAYQYSIGNELDVAYGKLDVAELAGFPTALTAIECATVLTNLQARYSTIL